MQSPLISILIPAFNAEKFIGECLDSIVSQTYTNIQVVIVDDGSTDSTLEICNKYQESHSYIEVYHTKNSGVARTRNVLLQKRKGEYVLFVDSDDMIDKNMVADMVKQVQFNDLDLVTCGYTNQMDSYTITKKTDETEGIVIWHKATALEKFIYHREITGALWNKLIKSSLFNGISFDHNISYGEDALVIWQIFQKIHKIGIIDKKYYHYRINESGISNSSFDKKKMSSHIVWKRIATETNIHYPQFSELANANFAVADFWILFFAAIDNYPQDYNIRIYCNNLRNHLGLIRKYKLLTGKKFIAAICLAYNYLLSSKIITFLHKQIP